MRNRDWFLAVFGLVVAVIGGLSEGRGDLLFGGVAVVMGLSSWVVFSGSSFHWGQTLSDRYEGSPKNDEAL